MIFIGFLLLAGGITGDEELIPIAIEHLKFVGKEFWDAHRVIDGNNSTQADSCSCCAGIERPALIAIDLSQPYPLTKIEVFGRTDKEPEQSLDIQVCVGLFPAESCYITNILNFEIMFNPPRLGQFISVNSFGNTSWIMTICEIKAYRLKVVNVLKIPALKFSVNQTETFEQCKAERATNGLYSASYLHDSDLCEKCSATKESPPWWEIDFGQKVMGNFITIIGRLGDKEEQSDDLLVYTSNTSQTHDNHSLAAIVKDMKSKIGQLFYIGNRTFQYLMIRRWYNSVLTLCEVMVYKIDCESGSNGYSCHLCGQCKTGSVCDIVTGNCSSGCNPGWRGLACDEACGHGLFGDGCAFNCSQHCLPVGECDHINGSCLSGCTPGFEYAKNQTCETPCGHGLFGDGCAFNCSQHCLPVGECDHINGSCLSGCIPGFDYAKNNTCETPCNGFFGDNCTTACSWNCRDNETCNHVDGHCTNGCQPGYSYADKTCKKACNGFYGDNCTTACSLNCRDNETCNHADGHCTNGCQPGYDYADKTCKTACVTSKYGENCSKECNCKECHHVTGSCVSAESCFTGFTLRLADAICTKCDPGWYGDNCSMNCHCDECHNVNGSCALLSTPCHEGFHFANTLCKANDIESSSSAAVGGGVGAAVGVIVAIAVVVIVIRRRHMLKRHTEKHDTAEMTDISKTLSTSTGHENFAYSDAAGQKIYENPNIDDYYSFKSFVPGIKVHLLWDYIRKKTISGSSYFADEFSKLPTGLNFKHDVASLPENRGKNRYREMFAYDHSRVPLTKDKLTDSEYINACFIHGFEKVNKFIASQGPTEKMIDDFWRMIWQQRVEKIAMLTNLIELGTLKCLQYWPVELDGANAFGDVSVKYIGVEETYDYIIRTLNISKGKETRLVKQFHLKTWPDKDVPDTTWSLLDFWRAVDTNVSSNVSPIVVHCSAGVGRTGTFIALDNLIIQGRMEGSVRPFAMVEALRQQRVSMVQTKEQYVYLHEALAEALLIGTHHALTRQFENIYQYIIGKEKGSNSSRMDEQFDLIKKSVDDNAIEVYPPESHEPVYGNVETAMLELDAYRPQLMKRGSKFIQQLGTVLLPTFGNTNSLLVCMSPTDQHLEEFWSLVEEQHVTTVISLAAPGSAPYETCQYLGARGSGRVGQFSVNYIHEKKNNGSVEKTFSFRDEKHEDEEYLTTIKQFQLTSWLEGHDTPSDLQSFLDLIEEVLKWQPHLSDKRPILIHCQTGFIRCGLTAVVLNEIQRIRKENGQINIVESVKTMKTRCRDLVQNKTQYRFCYEAILTYIKNSGTYQNL